jgi:STE24 endopeptidase
MWFILSGVFNFIDKCARSFNAGTIVTGLIFSGIIMMILQILNIPFSVYHTFVIEEKYGFNRTNLRTFILDILKKWTIAAVIWIIVFSTVIWFFQRLEEKAWFYSWIAVSLFQIFFVFIVPIFIMPLFNKFTPLEEGELKKAVKEYTDSQNFRIKEIFKMDASRRSTKANAFFTGFGKSRCIALFDTLVEKLTLEEIVSVLAHEIGHFKKRHILKKLVFSIFTTAIMFFLLSIFINNPKLFEAFKIENISLYAGLFIFFFLWRPINFIFSVWSNFLSRKYEYQADKFAVLTYKKPEAFISALKKLSIDHLSNLTPHPLKVFFHYHHPPVLDRIRFIQKLR